MELSDEKRFRKGKDLVVIVFNLSMAPCIKPGNIPHSIFLKTS